MKKKALNINYEELMYYIYWFALQSLNTTIVSKKELESL